MSVKTRTSTAGNKLEQIWVPSSRYAFDFGDGRGKGWYQYDTDQDASYYGVWYNPRSLQTLSYCEGDIYLVTCDTWDQFKAELSGMDDFHGKPPPAFIASEGITASDGKIKPVNVTDVYFDSDARLAADAVQPDRAEPITIDSVAAIFCS